MRVAVIALLAALAFPPASFAAWQARDSDGTTVTLVASPCVSEGALSQLPRLNESLAASGLPPVPAEALRAASVLFKGREYQACWVLIQGTVAVLDDGGQDNSLFAVPATQFREHGGI